jgi:hypothetical protein
MVGGEHVRRLFQWQTGFAACEQRLFDAGAWLLTDQVAEEQEESVPSQRREQHWAGWRIGRGYSSDGRLAIPSLAGSSQQRAGTGMKTVT